MPITIRRADPADAPTLAAFAEHCFRDAFGDLNTPGNMDRYVATAFSPALQRTELDDPTVTTLLAHDEHGALAGYAQVFDDSLPPFAHATPPAEVRRFYIDRPHHGRGVAQQLMLAVFEAAGALGRRALWLQVWERNFRGRAFYEKLGFVEVGERDFVLGDEVQTDRVLVLDFRLPE
jgi:GNAT superfamily N-acetyltransferase